MTRDGGAAPRSVPLHSRPSPFDSRRLRLFAAVALAFAVWALHRPDAAGFVGDRAMFAYFSQAVARGEPLYRTTMFAYPPLGPMIGAVGVRAAEAVGAAGYFGPRVLGLVVLAATVIATAALVQGVVGSAAWGLFAGLAVLTDERVVQFATTGLEPKALVALLAVLALLCVQRGRWAWAGTCAGLAASCWLQASLVGASLAAYALARPDRARRLPALVGGGVLGGVPALAFLAVTGQLGALIERVQQRVVVGGAIDQPALQWFRVLRGLARDRIVPVELLALALLGLVLWSARRVLRTRPDWLESPALAALAVTTVVFLAYFACAGLRGIEGLTPADVGPVYPLLMIWAAVAAAALCGYAGRDLAPALIAYAAGVVVVQGAASIPPASLAEDRRRVEALAARTGSEPVFAVNAIEIHVLAGSATPTPYWTLAPGRRAIMLREEGLDCAGFGGAIAAGAHPVVVLGPYGDAEGCARALVSGLAPGFDREAVGRYLVFTRRPPGST